MDINVTDTHIARGCRKSPAQCPVALAIKEQLPYPDFLLTRTISVGVHLVNIRNSNDVIVQQFLLPQNAVRRIHFYDETGIMSPFSLTLVPYVPSDIPLEYEYED